MDNFFKAGKDDEEEEAGLEATLQAAASEAEAAMSEGQTLSTAVIIEDATSRCPLQGPGQPVKRVRWLMAVLWIRKDLFRIRIQL